MSIILHFGGWFKLCHSSCLNLSFFFFFLVCSFLYKESTGACPDPVTVCVHIRVCWIASHIRVSNRIPKNWFLLIWKNRYYQSWSFKLFYSIVLLCRLLNLYYSFHFNFTVVLLCLPDNLIFITMGLWECITKIKISCFSKFRELFDIFLLRCSWQWRSNTCIEKTGVIIILQLGPSLFFLVLHKYVNYT